MTQFTKNVMCAECPFRADAPPGWLGNYTVDQLHALIHENNQHLLCHMHVKEVLENYTDDDDEDVSADRLLDNWGEHCVGALRYMSSVCRLANDRERAEAQRRLKKIPDKALIPPFKFREYHTRGFMAEATKQHDRSLAKKPKVRLGDRLRKQGFDRTTYDRSSGSYSVKCSQCQAMVINGTPCHERGCPNSK